MKTAHKLTFFLVLLGIHLCGEDAKLKPFEKAYKQVDGISLKVDIFTPPANGNKLPRPAMAFFHGGGWAYGERSEFHEACVRYAKMGMVTFSFEYRLSINPDGSVPHPKITPVECVKDARSAMRWIKENAARYRIDADRIVACGQSAGGQLALATALLDHINEESDNMEISPVPAAIVLYSSSVNMVEAWADMLLGDRRNEIWSISPHHNLRPGLPPMIEFHGEEDEQVPIWAVRHFRDKTISLGNVMELVIFEGRQHYLGEGDSQYGRYYDEAILKKTDAFLKQQGVLPLAN